MVATLNDDKTIRPMQTSIDETARHRVVPLAFEKGAELRDKRLVLEK